MQHLSHGSRRHDLISENFRGCQDQVRFFALHRIKPHAPPLVRAPSIHLSFNLRPYSPGGRLNALAPEATPQGHNLQVDRLRRGLPGYLILFAPTLSHLSVSLVQGPPSPPVFLQISAHSPLHLEFYPSTRLKLASIRCSSQVEPGISHLT